jgi:predicted amidohydrolase
MNLDFRSSLEDAIAKVDQSIAILSDLVGKAAESGCDIALLPEDCLCTTAWESGNPERAKDLLRPAVAQMLERLGNAAADGGVYLICSNDRIDSEGGIRNTAYFLDRTGGRIGHYDKVCFPVQEFLKTPGDGFPVFDTPDLGTVGILICYDMVFPEPARCLALEGADIIFNPTVGGAAFGGAEISRAAFRTRAAENFTYLAVSWGGWGADVGSVIISPKGEVLAESLEAGGIAIADIDPLGGRENADWSNAQTDMRSRLFRERRPDAFGTLTSSSPPALDKLPNIEPAPPTEIAEMVRKATTVGHHEYERAEQLLREGNTSLAKDAFRKLIDDYPNTWFDRTARDRLAEL